VSDSVVAHNQKPEKPKSEKVPVFRFLAGMLIPLFEVMMKFVVIDGHKVPKSGAFVLSPNHLTNIDPVIVGRVLWKLGRAPRFLAKASLFTIPFVGWVLAKSGQVPVQRTGVTRGADPLAAGELIVEKGLAVVVYPEGSLTRDPEFWPMRGKYGAVRMALEAKVPLIPAAHWGDQQILPPYGGGFHPFPRRTVTVKFGDPLDLSRFDGRPIDSAMLAEATGQLMEAIAQLVGELRNETPRAERWDPVQHNQTEIGKF
jgi:1-acyl-sn-glycerol-3-phosphate acyltransferase